MGRQPSELFRRGVVVPLNQEAESQIRSWNISATAQVKVLDISTQELFDRLWQLGLFDEINRQCDSLVDDYEEELIEFEKTPCILAAIDRIQLAVMEDLSVRSFLFEFRQLAELAQASKMPLLFVL